MEVLVCLVVGLGDGATGSTLLSYPDYGAAEVVGWVDYGEWVTFNISDRSGYWAEITDGEGEIGWIETSYLSDCQ